MNGTKKHTSISIPRLIFIAIVFLATGAMATHLGQAAKIWITVRNGIWWWTVVAVLLQLAFQVNQSALYYAIYQMVGLPAGFRYLFKLVMSASFVSAVVPGGTFSGTGFMVYDALRRNFEAAGVLLANIIFFLFDYLAFFITLLIAFLYLFSRGTLQRYELIAAFILLVITCAVIILLLFVALKPTMLIRMLLGGLHVFDRLPFGFARPAVNRDNVVINFIHRVSAALKISARNRPALFRGIMHALLVEAIGLLQLNVLFLAFGGGPDPGQLITGYAVGVLFMIVSITPQGVGFMEGAMATAYVAVGVPPDQAVIVTFIYRTISFWLPMLFGAMFFKRVVIE